MLSNGAQNEGEWVEYHAAARTTGMGNLELQGAIGLTVRKGLGAQGNASPNARDHPRA